MKKVNIVGVPEHFNLAWHLCIDNGEFNEVGIDLSWTDVPEGTGKMCEMLRDKSTDLAVILTEGIVKDIAQGNPSKIVQEFVSSPLLWGIHVANQSPFETIDHLENKRVAISRFGSGSHLMAIVHAEQKGWDVSTLEFVVVDNFANAVLALEEGRADYFMWERFMTQPTVDAGVFRRLGECPTPWPSFVIVATAQFASEHKALINNLLEVINRTTSEFKSIPSIDRTLSTTFNQKIEDIQTWLGLTRWSQKQLNESTFNQVQNHLLALNIIHEPLAYSAVISEY